MKTDAIPELQVQGTDASAALVSWPLALRLRARRGAAPADLSLGAILSEKTLKLPCARKDVENEVNVVPLLIPPVR